MLETWKDITSCFHSVSDDVGNISQDIFPKVVKFVLNTLTKSINEPGK